jgi:predicted nucleotidyltransferase
MNMIASGVIVEYNPFHNGHLYHLEQTKAVSNCDITIAVMSGYFLQRGEPALVSKWSRTKMALLNGIDIVVELPYAFSTQKAEVFANGAISILEALNCRFVCFGSESGNIDAFTNTVEILNNKKNEFDHYLKQYIQQGNSYPKSASLAFKDLKLIDAHIDLSLPNNILGYHYVKAILDQQARIKPLTITRTAANYHDQEFNSTPIASATSIRKALFSEKGQFEDVTRFVPNATYFELEKYYNEHKILHSWEDYYSLLKFKVLTSTPEELSNIYEVEEGIEHRIIKYIKESSSFINFMEKLKTKRYTWTRLQRMCVHILTNTTKQTMQNCIGNNKATYVRLLGMTTKGRSYLQQNKKNFPIPVLSKLSNSADSMLELDIRASQSYFMALPEPLRTELLKIEYSTPPIQIQL